MRSRFQRSYPSALTRLAIFGVVLVVGCAPLPRVEIERDISAAAQVNSAVVFSEDGAPDDDGNSTVERLTLVDATERAVRTQPQIQSAIARVRIAQAEAKQSRLLPNPILSVVARWPLGGGQPDIDVGLTADLISMLAKPGQISAADNRLRASAAEAMSVVLDLLVEVQDRYVAVQTNDQQLLVLDDRARIVDRLLDIARSRLEIGEGTRLDVLSLEAQRVELQTELAERRLERQDDRIRLARLIGQPSAPADWHVTPWTRNPMPQLSESQWIAMGLTNRPEVHQQRYELAALGHQLELTQFAAFEGTEVGAQGEGDEGDWKFGPSVAVPVPIFDMGQARRERTHAALIEARHKLTDLRRQVIEETRRAYAAFVAHNENLERVRTELVPLVERRLEQAEAQFRAGQTDVTSLLQAEQELRAARTRQIGLQRRSTEALIRLQRAVGGPAVVAAGNGDAVSLQKVAVPGKQED